MSFKIKIVIISLLVATSIVVLSSCAKSSEKEAASVTTSVIMDEEIGKEAICPVLGDTFKISRSTPVVKYKGQRYYFCCEGCDDKFMEDPEKYIQENNKQEMQQSTSGATSEEEIAYWTCSMHPEVKSDKEGTCPICGMNLIPVKKSNNHEKMNNNSFLYLKERDIALSGIKMVPAEKKKLYKEISAVGMVAYDPTLVTTQEEYLNALQLLENINPEDNTAYERAKTVLAKAAYKLKLLGMSASEIETLQKKREVQTSFVIPENESWVYADIYESDIGWIKKNQNATVEPVAYPDLQYEGRIESINPVLDMETRATQVRIRLSRKDKKLLPGMYVDVKIKAEYTSSPGSGDRVVAVPKEAVINTGNRKVVWVYAGEGNFEPREVKVGSLASANNGTHEESYYPILHGIKENEMVVTNGNFLLDSESQITGVAAIGYGGAIGVGETPHHGH